MAKKSDGTVVIDIEADLDKFTSTLNKISKVAAVSFASLTAAVGKLGQMAFDVGNSFETAFAGVKKTVEATEEEFGSFRKEIIEMSKTIPITANELANITEVAGQLGIKNENLMAFTRTMADLGVATNMTSTEAATTLARFANITQMGQSEFGRLGSTIVALGNNMATTESEIADMALNLAGAGKQVGMTESQILALSASLSSVGIEAALGGTAMSSLLIDIKKSTLDGGKKLEDFAKVANMTANDFKTAFEKDAGNALQKFITGLGTAKERGIEAITLLGDAGIKEDRMTKALLNAANASDVFNKAFDISNTAWKENTALVNEAGQRYETMESQMTILKNKITEVGISAYDKFREPIKEAFKSASESVDIFSKELTDGQLNKSIDNIADSFGKFLTVTSKIAIKILPLLIDGLNWMLQHGDVVVAFIGSFYAALKGGKAIIDVTALLQRFTVQMALAGMETGLTGTKLMLFTAKTLIADKATKLLTLSTTSLYMVMGGVAVAAVSALVVGFIKYINKANEATKTIKEKQKAMDDLTKSAIESFNAQSNETLMLKSNYDELLKNIDATGKYTGNKDRMLFLINELNKAFPDLHLNYDAETGKIMTQTGELSKNTDAVKKLIEAKQLESYLSTNQEVYTKAKENERNAIKELIDAQRELNELRALEKPSFDESYRANILQLETIPALQEVINKNGELARSYEDIQTKALSGDITGALDKIKGIGEIQLYDAKKGAEQIDALKNQVKDIETELSTIEQIEVNMPDMAGKFEERKKVLMENHTLALQQLQSAEMAYDEMMLLQKTNAGIAQGDAQAAKYIETYTPKANIGMESAGTTSAEAFKTTSTRYIDSIIFPDKFVNIYAKYIGFDGPKAGASRGMIGAFPGSSYDDSESFFSSIQPSFSSLKNNVLGNIKIPINSLKQGSNQVINQTIEFNQPIETPSQVSKAIQKASKELAKVR